MLPPVPQAPQHPALSGTPGLPPGDVGLFARLGGTCARPPSSPHPFIPHSGEPPLCFSKVVSSLP